MKRIFQKICIPLSIVLISVLGTYGMAYGMEATDPISQDGGTAVISVEIDISTLEQSKYGVEVKNGGSITLDLGGKVVTKGSMAYALYSYEANSLIQSLQALNIETSGSSAHGVYVHDDASINLASGSEITTIGEKSMGIAAAWGGKIVIDEDTIIKTSGNDAAAIFIRSVDDNDDHVSIPSIEIAEGVQIITSGNNSHGIHFYGGGNISLESATIHVNERQGSYAIFSETFNAGSIDKGATISGEGVFDIKGPIVLGDYSKADLKFAEGSSFVGFTSISGTVSALSLNMLKSSWILTADSKLTSLKLDASVVDMFSAFSDREVFDESTFIKLNMLLIEEGTDGGTFVMKVDMNKDLPEPLGDYMFINSVTGKHVIKIEHKDKGGADELLIIEAKACGPEQLTLAGGPVISIGSYKYELSPRDYYTKWYLERIGRDPNIEEDVPKSLLGLFEFAKAVNATLSDDLLNAKNDIWFISHYKLQKFSHSDLTSDFKQQIFGGTFGLDQDITDNLSVGEFFGLNLGYQNFREGSVGHIANLTAGAYVTYHIGGLKANAYARVSDYIQDLRLLKEDNAILSETLRTKGFSASGQVSYKIGILGSGFYIEPKGKVTYTYVMENTYNIGGMEIKNFAEKGVTTWLGARLGLEKEKDSEYRNYYFEAGWYHDTNPSITYLIIEDNDERPITIGKNRFEVGIGINLNPLSQSDFSVEIKYAKGEGITEPIKLKIAGSVYF